MNVTIKDVARTANVSVATVSRVLNNKNNVSEEAVQAVNRAVKELGYSPSFLGHDVRKNETKRILAVLGSAEQSFHIDVIRGMQDAAYKEGYDILIASTRNDPEHEMHLLGMLFSRAVDGAVLISPKLDERTVSDLSRRYKLAVCPERLDVDGLLCVTINNERAGYDATHYLIGKGCRRIGLITVTERSYAIIDREEGYKHALEEAGLDVDPDLVYRGDFSADTGSKGCEQFMSLSEKPDAIFSISDSIAVGAMTYAVQRGITIGRDLLFFGFDNTASSHMFIPRLSTVGQPCYLQGKTVIEKLILNIQNEIQDKTTYFLPHSLILRESTGD